MEPCRAERHPAEHGRDDEGRDPNEQQVLDAEHRGERPGEESAHNRPEDPAGAEDREQPLRLTRVDHRPCRSPEPDRLCQRGKRDRHPEHGIDPTCIGQQDPALGDHHRGEEHRGPDVDRAVLDALQDGRQSEHRHQGDARLREVHHRQRLGSDAVEEERVDGAFSDRRAGERGTHQRRDECDGPSLARVDAEESHGLERPTWPLPSPAVAARRHRPGTPSTIPGDGRASCRRGPARDREPTS